MSKFSTGSLCLTTILEQAKAGHSAFSKADNGKIYFNVGLWENEEADKFGNNMSMQLNSKKDSNEPKCYIGNLKWTEKKETHISQDEIPTPEQLADDLPF